MVDIKKRKKKESVYLKTHYYIEMGLGFMFMSPFSNYAYQKDSFCKGGKVDDSQVFFFFLFFLLIGC